MNDVNTKGELSLYEYLTTHTEGDLSVLSNYNQKEITHLCKLGLMTRGLDSRNEPRYKLTSSGRSQVRVMGAEERVESALDTILSVLV